MCLGALGTITARWDEGGVPMGRVDLAEAAERPVCLLYTPEARVGDHVLVHLGFALEVLDEDDAAAATLLRAQLDAPPADLDHE